MNYFDDISVDMKKRFCKDCNLHINIFQEPYFMERLKLYDRFYRTLSKWDLFRRCLEKYNCEQDYFEDYNRIKDAAITDIKNSEGYRKFNEIVFEKEEGDIKVYPKTDIMKTYNDGKFFISVDMKQANFNALRYFSPDIFNNKPTWELFISQYTDNKHIIASKYIRQVILGNCNCKKNINFEKRIMDRVAYRVKKANIPNIEMYSCLNDEIIYQVNEWEHEKAYSIYNDILKIMEEYFNSIPFKVDYFKLCKIDGCKNGYYKSFLFGGSENVLELKGLDSETLPFVLRKFYCEEIQEDDKVFYHNGMLAKFIETPQITVDWAL